jgi:hypothetical protein
MTETETAARTCRSRRSLAWQARAVVVSLLLNVSNVTVAQQAVIDHCRKTSSDADRIACLEAALIGRGDGAARPAPAAQIDPPSMDIEAGPVDDTIEPETQSQIDPPGMEPDAGPADTATEETLPMPPAKEPQSSRATPAAAAPSRSQQAAPAEPAAEPEGLGAEQVIVRNQSRDGGRRVLEEVRGLRVSGYDKVPFERLVVKLENGQVWRQIKGDTQQIRVDLRRNQTVDISEASMSGYKMRLNEIRRTIRVERIR